MPNVPRHTDGAPPYSHSDELEHWKTEYLEIRQMIANEAEGISTMGKPVPVAAQAIGHDRRREPRYSFMPESKIYAHMGPRAFPIVNISIGGLAFFSDLQFEPGTKLLMSALGMIALDVEVLDCTMEETDATMMEYRYRVRAKFSAHVNGYQVYVLAREMHLQNVKDKSSAESPRLDAKP